MKRSEAIEMLSNKLMFMGHRKYVLAYDILDFIENKIEMLPPEHLFTSGERNDHYLNEWEHE